MDFGNTYDAVVHQALETRRLSQGRSSHVHIDHVKIIDSTVIADLGGACSPVRAVANSAIRVVIEVRETHVCKTDYVRQGQHYQSRRETWFDGKAPESEAEIVIKPFLAALVFTEVKLKGTMKFKCTYPLDSTNRY